MTALPVQAAEQASQSGIDFESEIEEGMAALGLEFVQSSDWNEARLYENPNLKIVVKNAPYSTIYGHRSRIEFLVILGAERQIIVEAKRQNTSGSTDEKFPYVYLNAVKNIPDREYVLVLDGNGWKEEALDWINAKAEETQGFYVFDAPAFITWLKQQVAH